MPLLRPPKPERRRAGGNTDLSTERPRAQAPPDFSASMRAELFCRRHAAAGTRMRLIPRKPKRPNDLSGHRRAAAEPLQHAV